MQRKMGTQRWHLPAETILPWLRVRAPWWRLWGGYHHPADAVWCLRGRGKCLLRLLSFLVPHCCSSLCPRRAGAAHAAGSRRPVPLRYLRPQTRVGRGSGRPGLLQRALPPAVQREVREGGSVPCGAISIPLPSLPCSTCSSKGCEHICLWQVLRVPFVLLVPGGRVGEGRLPKGTAGSTGARFFPAQFVAS